MKKLVLFMLVLSMMMATMSVFAHPALSPGDITPQGDDHDCNLQAGNTTGYAVVRINYGHDLERPYDINRMDVEEHTALGAVYGSWNWDRYNVTVEIWQHYGHLPRRLARKVCP